MKRKIAAACLCFTVFAFIVADYRDAVPDRYQTVGSARIHNCPPGKTYNYHSDSCK